METNGGAHEYTQQQPSELTRYGLRKDELVRVLQQALHALGYNESAALLEKESAIKLQSDAVAVFRHNLLNGEWDAVLNQLPVLRITDPDKLKSVRFLIFRQKFLEQLEQRNVREALQTLRQELTPVSRDSTQLHKLTSLVMCQTPEDLYKRAAWDGIAGNSRKELVDDLQKYISPALLMPENRLEKLLVAGVKYNRIFSTGSAAPATTSTASSSSMQIDGIEDQSALCENPFELPPFSLFEEHFQPESIVPRNTLHVLETHSDEVWYVQFSRDGRYLASASSDHTAIIYEIDRLGIKGYKPVVCIGHTDTISCLSFSPDSSLLLTGSNDKTVRVFNVKSGDCIRTFDTHKDHIAACEWLPDGCQFLSAAGASDRSIRRWNATTGQLLDTWKTQYKIHDFALSSDGRRLAVASHQRKIFVYDLQQQNYKEPLFTLLEDEQITSMSMSTCNRYILVNLHRSDDRGAIHMWDLEKRTLMREFTGLKQSRFIIRSCFAGPNDSLVISGSEDGQVYIWERQTARSLAVLSGHASSVNTVAWRPMAAPLNSSSSSSSEFMFASASDDNTVRVWTHVDTVKEIP